MVESDDHHGNGLKNAAPNDQLITRVHHSQPRDEHRCRNGAQAHARQTDGEGARISSIQAFGNQGQEGDQRGRAEKENGNPNQDALEMGRL